MTPKGPHIDWAGLSPLIALLGAATIVLLVGLLRPRAVREVLVPLLAFAGFAAAIGLGIWQYGEQKDLIAGALRLDDLTIVLSFVFCAGGAAAVLLSWRAVAPREAAHGEYFALMLTSAAGMWVLVAAQNLVTAVPRPRAALDPALRAVRHRDAPRDVAGGRAEVPDHRLGRLGDAALRPGLHLRRDRHRPTSRASPMPRAG